MKPKLMHICVLKPFAIINKKDSENLPIFQLILIFKMKIEFTLLIVHLSKQNEHHGVNRKNENRGVSPLGNAHK